MYNTEVKGIELDSFADKYSYLANRRTILIGFFLVALIILPDKRYAHSASYIKKHLNIYGNSTLLDDYPERIASEFTTVVTEWWKYRNVQSIKRLNSNITILFYRSCNAALESYDDWEQLKSRDEWFVKDTVLGKRIKHKIHGWYLMDITNQQFRHHLVDYLLNKLSEYPEFNGIFLDEAPAFIDPTHFLIEGSTNNVVLKSTYMSNYYGSMISFLKELKTRVGSKLVFINSNDTASLVNEVDGVMLEGFIHGQWEANSYFPDMFAWAAHMQKLTGLLAKDKEIMVHSGTMGTSYDDPAVIKQFRFLLSSYLLISNEKSSFSFVLSTDNNLLPSYDEYKLNLGSAVDSPVTVAIKSEVLFHDSLQNLNGWTVYRPSYIQTDYSSHVDGDSSLRFDGSNGDGPYMQRYISVPHATERKLTISCSAKASNIKSGDVSWKRFGVLGKFLDSSKVNLKGGVDLLFDTQSYDWTRYDEDYAVTPTTSYYFISAFGFYPGAKGIGSADNMTITLQSVDGTIFSRHFDNLKVFVNPTGSSQSLTLPLTLFDIAGSQVHSLNLPRGSGTLLLNKSILPPINLRLN